MSMRKQGFAEVRKASVCFKLLCLLLCSVCLFTSCTKKINTESSLSDAKQIVPTADLKMPYSASDSLNPFFCTTQQNASIMSLICQGLFALREDMTPMPVIAASYEAVEKTVRVTLPTNGVFSDGSVITSADVVYSFDRAKSSPAYSGALAGISAAVANSPLEVTFQYADRCPNGVNLLTFPIVKSNSAQTAEQIVVGSGRFLLRKTENAVTLELNPYGSMSGEVRSITLVPVSDSGKLMYLLQTDAIDFFCSDLYGDRISRSNAKMISVPRNNLLFLGVNDDSYLLSFTNIRKALFYAVNRNEIAESVYSGNAVAAAIPVRPGTKMYTELAFTELSEAVDYASAEQCLVQEGFDTIGTDGIRRADKGTLSLTLLVNSESGYRTEAAACIRQSLSKVGISVYIKSLDYDAYTEALQSGNYDLYLGEVCLPDNGDLSAFFGGDVSFGIAADSKISLTYTELLQGSISMTAFMTDYLAEIPFVALGFRNDVLVFSDKLSIPAGTFLFADCYSSIADWKVEAGTLADEKNTQAPDE